MTEQKQENVQLLPEVAQQFKLIQARANTADLAAMDFRNEVNTLLQLLVVKLDKLQKENGDLKAKLETASKT
jgi:hypothetical protein